MPQTRKRNQNRKQIKDCLDDENQSQEYSGDSNFSESEHDQDSGLLKKDIGKRDHKRPDKKNKDPKEKQLYGGRPPKKGQQIEISMKTLIENLNAFQKLLVEKYGNQQQEDMVKKLQDIKNDLEYPLKAKEEYIQKLNDVVPEKLKKKVIELLEEEIEYGTGENYLKDKYDPQGKQFPLFSPQKMLNDLQQKMNIINIEYYLAIFMQEIFLRVSKDNFMKFYQFFGYGLKLYQQNIQQNAQQQLAQQQLQQDQYQQIAQDENEMVAQNLCEELKHHYIEIAKQLVQANPDNEYAKEYVSLIEKFYSYQNSVIGLIKLSIKIEINSYENNQQYNNIINDNENIQQYDT